MDKIQNEIDQKLSIFHLSDVDSIWFSTFENICLAAYNSQIDKKKIWHLKMFPRSKIPNYNKQQNSPPN